MSISDEQAKEWAEYFIGAHNEFYEYSDVYEEDDFTDEFPDPADWEKVHSFMTAARIGVSWDG